MVLALHKPEHLYAKIVVKKRASIINVIIPPPIKIYLFANLYGTIFKCGRKFILIYWIELNITNILTFSFVSKFCEIRFSQVLVMKTCLKYILKNFVIFTKSLTHNFIVQSCDALKSIDPFVGLKHILFTARVCSFIFRSMEKSLK